MNNDNMFIVILVTFPVVVGGLVTLILLLSYRMSSRECPHCFRRIPKDALDKGVPCPECGTELAESDYAIPTDLTNHPCRECGASIDCVELWDGETYCTTCVEKHSPQLLELVGSKQLTEDMPYSIGAVTLRMFLFGFAVIGGFATIVALPFAIGGNWQKALQFFGVILLIGSPVILLKTCAGAAAMPLMRLKVMAWNRQLIVRLGTSLLIAPLAECSWHEGKLSQMTVWKYAVLLLRGPALIVELPKETAKHGNRVAVGYTPETFDIWQSFFTIAGVPRTPPKQSWWSRRKRKKATSPDTAAF